MIAPVPVTWRLVAGVPQRVGFAPLAQRVWAAPWAIVDDTWMPLPLVMSLPPAPKRSRQAREKAPTIDLPVEDVSVDTVQSELSWEAQDGG